jgi:hypothetical protein
MKLLKLLPFALLCAAACAFAQGSALAGMDPFQFHAADVQILQAKPVQAELKISEAQRNAMNKFAAQHRKHLEDLEQEYEKKKKPMSDAQKDPRIVGYFLELKTNVMRQLSKYQLKRLSELSLQRAGMAAITDDVVAKKVGLTTAQLTKYRDAFKTSGEKYAAAEQKAAAPVLAKYKNKKPKDAKEAEALRKQYNSDLEAALKKASPTLNAIRAQAEKTLLGLLTAKQKKAWTAVQGKPFKPK